MHEEYQDPLTELRDYLNNLHNELIPYLDEPSLIEFIQPVIDSLQQSIQAIDQQFDDDWTFR